MSERVGDGRGSPVDDVTRVETAEDIRRFHAVASLTPLSAETLASQRPSASYVVMDDGEPVARCSVWWTNPAPYQDQRVGVIGHYAASNARAGRRLLDHACAELAAHGRTLAVGPMDGDTFHSYRLVTDRGTEPRFFLEPDNPDDYPEHFTDSGFHPLAHYCSALQTELQARQPRVSAIADRLANRGVRIRSLNLAHFEDELRRIYAVTSASFVNGALYTPIAEERFLDLYRPLRPFVVPELVVVAEHDDRLAGFLFAIPDRLQALRGERMDTVVVKTIAVVPELARSGLVGLLLARGIAGAHEMGYTRAIHALMHEHNTSVRLSARYAGRIMRRYALFARSLSQEQHG